jgi:hypothetical protein
MSEQFTGPETLKEQNRILAFQVHQALTGQSLEEQTMKRYEVNLS